MSTGQRPPRRAEDASGVLRSMLPGQRPRCTRMIQLPRAQSVGGRVRTMRHAPCSAPEAKAIGRSRVYFCQSSSGGCGTPQRRGPRGGSSAATAGASRRPAAKLSRACPQRSDSAFRLAPCTGRIASGLPERLQLTSARPAANMNSACATSSSSVDRPKPPRCTRVVGAEAPNWACPCARAAQGVLREVARGGPSWPGTALLI